MLPELSIERVFRRELEALPVPDAGLWVPNRRAGFPLMLALSVAGAALVLVVAAIGLVRETSGAATQPRGAATAPPSLQPSATCEPPAYGANGRCFMFLPNLVRNEAFGYNLMIPGEWHEAQMPPGTEPFVRDRPTADPALTAPFLLDRRVFTGRATWDWVAPTDNRAPAWDLDVQVWDRQGRTALEWSRTFGPCDPAVRTFGSTGCVPTMDTIRGATFVVTTVNSISGYTTVSYYLARGDHMLILRYSTDPNVAPPLGFTRATLEGIVHAIGLV
ncbi:MAG: hypothetical protein E6J13_06230 [Chloroflexi bacterium]|nr:MAG: hypothetical protein E6J13_06230 [Chloroflexota bacterium]